IGSVIKVSNTPKVEKAPETIYPDDIVINLVATGDVMCHTTNFNAAFDSSTKTYDFSPVFVNVAKYITKADIAIGNLETTFAGEDRGYTGYPTFNSPSSLGYALKNIGIDVLSTANNHSLDKGYTGIVSTLDALDEIGIDHMGTARSKEEQDKILVKDVNGIKIAFLSFTYGTNGIPVPAGREYSVNLIEEELILNQINAAKEQEVDLICASMHWGIEYSQMQSEDQEDLANYLFNHGVDIIIGNHAHVIEPMEKKTITLEDGTEKDVFVVYALGNFISGQTIKNTKTTAILDMQIRKSGETGKISIDSVDYTPVYCYDNGSSRSDRYTLIDIREAIIEYESGNIDNVSESLYRTLKTELANSEKVLGDPITKEETDN
ncbi:MAG: CapA family protein, partial [Clostridia bacterium]|nr:CapA family protein [Clostridia bacterium]